jgi:hypothetical protein
MSLFGFIVIISKNTWEVTTLCVIWCQKLNNTIRDQIRCKKIETLGSCKLRHFQMKKISSFYIILDLRLDPSLFLQLFSLDLKSLGRRILNEPLR